MGLIKDVVIDFCLFSLIEGFIFCLFFEKIGGCKKFKWYEIFILSIGNCIISQVFPPVVYQIIAIFYMSILLKVLKELKIIKSIRLVLISIILMMTIEMIFAIFYEVLFDIDFTKINTIKSFILSIPMKIIEIILIFFWRHKR